MKIREKLMHKYALSEQGAADMLKAFAAVTVSDLVLMVPVSLLYFLVKDYMEGNLGARAGFYIGGVACSPALPGCRRHTPFSDPSVFYSGFSVHCRSIPR